MTLSVKLGGVTLTALRRKAEKTKDEAVTCAKVRFDPLALRECLPLFGGRLISRCEDELVGNDVLRHVQPRNWGSTGGRSHGN
jgi:hypothetical protein